MYKIIPTTIQTEFHFGSRERLSVYRLANTFPPKSCGRSTVDYFPMVMKIDGNGNSRIPKKHLQVINRRSPKENSYSTSQAEKEGACRAHTVI